MLPSPSQARRAGVMATSLLLGVVAITLVAVTVGPRIGAFRTVTILSGSMEPTFGRGDVIVSTVTTARDVRSGDVITFHAPVAGRPLVTHRVSRLVERGPQPVVQTKGDANDAADPWVARLEDETVWQQRAVIPMAGHALTALARPGVRQVLLYGSLALFLGFGLRSIWTMPAERVR